MEVVIILLLCFYGGAAQGQTTDPGEVESLKVFANTLGIGDVWNFSVDPCSGLEGWNNTSGADAFLPTTAIECDCTNNATCHVTRIVVLSVNAAGQIAPEIGNFSFLNDLNLAQNVLTGTIPDEIGSLSRLQYFTVGINKLTGPFPGSIGKLTKLVSVGLGSNRFSGSLPKEIGNLQSLLKLYMDASGLSGEMPQEFGNLTKLETLYMADNDFNGTFPEFFGNLVALQDLKMHGNKFQGQIPFSLGKLQNLKTLDIGDVTSGGVIPPGFSLLKGLNKLTLRDCELSGPIIDLRNLTTLTLLDLSFNNLSGEIPATFGSLTLLENLLLGNNNLTGTLPRELVSLRNLQRLDVSYNQLTGPLPVLNNTKLQTNFVWNRFDTLQSDSLRCLVGRSNCSRVGNGKNFRFSINCGGPEVVTSTRTTFNDDTTAPMFGTYFSKQAWAVSSTGYSDGFVKAIETTTVPVLGTVDPILYQTARSAPSSLRYFGLGMVNGPYTLQLHFAEILLDNSSSWIGITRRVFDVYIQGTRVLKDFNVQNEARGSLKALVKSFSLQVLNNVIDIHFLWKGKGTCCYGPLISAIQLIPEFDTAGLVSELNDSHKSKGKQVGIGVAVSILCIILIALLLLLWSRKRRRRPLSEEEEDLKSLEGKPNLISYAELKAATEGFAPKNKLGQGGYGAVYKGVLTDGTVVAIKELSAKSNQGTREFLNEVTVISAVQHRNLVKLHGCCLEGTHRILVYEFLENNSLHQALLSSKADLHMDWPTRFNIIVGIARGIAYLHEDSLPRIVHRDIKASNILLDKNLNPKIADFGLAKLFQDLETHVSTRVAGTIGYLAPEYAMRGQLTEKADVYSFGVLALEIVSGRSNLETSLPSDMVYLLEWAWQLYEDKRALELLDVKADNASEEQVLRTIEVALLCSQAVASSRPFMSHVVSMLIGTASVDVMSLQPGYFSALKQCAPDGFFSGGTSTKTSHSKLMSTASEASTKTSKTSTSTSSLSNMLTTSESAR